MFCQQAGLLSRPPPPDLRCWHHPDAWPCAGHLRTSGSSSSPAQRRARPCWSGADSSSRSGSAARRHGRSAGLPLPGGLLGGDGDLLPGQSRDNEQEGGSGSRAEGREEEEKQEEDEDDVPVKRLPKKLAARLHLIEERMERFEAHLERLAERNQERDMSLAAAIKEAAEAAEAAPAPAAAASGAAACEGKRGKEGCLDEGEEDSEQLWDNLLDTYTAVMSKGYLQSMEKIRERLMVSEWVLSRRDAARRQGVAAFERYCAENKVAISFEALTALYLDPGELDLVEDVHLRMQLRSFINEAVDREHDKVYGACTAEAQKLAAQFSQTELIGKLLPESGVLEVMKKVVPAALKLAVGIRASGSGAGRDVAMGRWRAAAAPRPAMTIASTSLHL